MLHMNPFLKSDTVKKCGISKAFINVSKESISNKRCSFELSIPQRRTLGRNASWFIFSSTTVVSINI